jgi:hypothetical protein
MSLNPLPSLLKAYNELPPEDRYGGLVLLAVLTVTLNVPSGNAAVTIIGLVLLVVVGIVFAVLVLLRPPHPADAARSPVDAGCGAAKLFDEITSQLLVHATGDLARALQLDLSPNELVDAIRAAISLLARDVDRLLTVGPRKVLTDKVTLPQLQSILPDTLLAAGESLEVSAIGPRPAKRSSATAIRQVADRYGLTSRIIAELSRLRPDPQ